MYINLKCCALFIFTEYLNFFAIVELLIFWQLRARVQTSLKQIRKFIFWNTWPCILYRYANYSNITHRPEVTEVKFSDYQNNYTPNPNVDKLSRKRNHHKLLPMEYIGRSFVVLLICNICF